MSELLIPILPVIGVVIGFLLAQLTDFGKNKRKQKTIKNALINELNIIRKTLSNAPEQENRIPDEQHPFIIETYESVRTELASFMNPNSLGTIQRTYEEIRKMNSEGRGHIIIAGSLDHIFQFSDFKKIIALIDDSIANLR